MISIDNIEEYSIFLVIIFQYCFVNNMFDQNIVTLQFMQVFYLILYFLLLLLIVDKKFWKIKICINTLL